VPGPNRVQMNATDGTAFDRDWSNNRGASAITAHRASTQNRATIRQQHEEMSATDRELVRQGQERYRQDQQRMIAEARGGNDRTREPSRQPSRVSRPMLSYDAPSPQPGRHGGETPSARGGSERDARLAAQLAQTEARRAGLY